LKEFGDPDGEDEEDGDEKKVHDFNFI